MCGFAPVDGFYPSLFPPQRFFADGMAREVAGYAERNGPLIASFSVPSTLFGMAQVVGLNVKGGGAH